MGCGASSSASSKVYAKEEADPLVEEIRPHFDALSVGEKGVPCAKLGELYAAVTESATPMADAEVKAAIAQVDPSGAGYFLLPVFVQWFQTPQQESEQKAPEPEIHESVRRGLKDEGVAEGTAEYDAEMAELAAEAAEREKRAMEADAKEREMQHGSGANSSGAGAER